ncbi:MAG TPA: hypothetical protein VNS63_18160 [Blastocatellia bacterium]|nr:hypothetical protein [Blastocatellia bacterium]
MADASNLVQKLQIIDHLMESVCETSTMRFKELEGSVPSERTKEKSLRAFEMITDLCELTRVHIKQLLDDVKESDSPA